MVNLTAVRSLPDDRAESDPRASNESLCGASPAWKCPRSEPPNMTIWELKVFSWSGNKTNKGDLLIKINFHSQEKFGSLANALISIVAQSWERRSQALSGKLMNGIKGAPPPSQEATQRLSHIQAPNAMGKTESRVSRRRLYSFYC